MSLASLCPTKRLAFETVRRTLGQAIRDLEDPRMAPEERLACASDLLGSAAKLFDVLLGPDDGGLDTLREALRPLVADLVRDAHASGEGRA